MRIMTSKSWLVILSVGLLLIMFSNGLAQPLATAMLLNGLAIAGLAGLQLLRRRKKNPDKHTNHSQEE